MQKIIGKFTYNKSKWFEIVPSISGLAKLWGAVLKTLPSLIGLLIFSGSKRGWTVVDMKSDPKVVYPFEIPYMKGEKR